MLVYHFLALSVVCLELFLVLLLGQHRGARGLPSRDALLIYSAKCTGTHEAESICLYQLVDQIDAKMEKKKKRAIFDLSTKPVPL